MPIARSLRANNATTPDAPLPGRTISKFATISKIKVNTTSFLTQIVAPYKGSKHAAQKLQPRQRYWCVSTDPAGGEGGVSKNVAKIWAKVGLVTAGHARYPAW